MSFLAMLATSHSPRADRQAGPVRTAWGSECGSDADTVGEKRWPGSRQPWTIPGLGSPLRSVIRLPIITSLSVGPNTRARDRRPATRVASLGVDAAETLAVFVARLERFGLTLEEM